MSTKVKTIAAGAAVILLLAAAALVIIFGKSGNSGDYSKQLEQAAVYMENYDFDNAIAIYNGVIASDSTCAEAYTGLAEAYYSKGRTDKAYEVLEKGEENTDGDESVLKKMRELFPDGEYSAALPNEFDEGYFVDGYGFEDEGTETEPAEPETAVTEATEEVASETETSETEVPETETTTETTPETTAAPVTAVTTVPTTAAPVTAAPVTTAPPAPVITNPPVTTAPPVTTTAPVTTTRETTTTTRRIVMVDIPNFTDMSLDEAYSWCSKNNIVLNTSGAGNGILSQSPAPGAVVEEGSAVIVILSD